MTVTKGQNSQDVQQSPLPVMGAQSRTDDETLFLMLEKHLDFPLRMFATLTADKFLHIGTSQVVMGDGGAEITPPVDDNIAVFPLTTIDMQTGAVTGGTITIDGASFQTAFQAARDATPVGDFRRLVFAFTRDGSLSAKFSSVFSGAYLATSLTNPGTLLGVLDGQAVGYLDVESYNNGGTNAFKTAGSATGIIENAVGGVPRIWRFGSGGGGGGGSDRTYKITAFSATGCGIKGGYLALDNSAVLASGTGTSSLAVGVDLTVNLNTVLTQSSLSFAADTLYTLAIDLYTLELTAFTLTDTDRKVFRWSEANLKLVVGSPDTLNPQRFVWLNQIKTADAGVNWSDATAIVKPSRIHNTLADYFPYLEEFNSAQITIATSQTLSHGLPGEPQIVQVAYFDGTNKRILATDSHLTNKTATQLTVATYGLTFGTGQYVEVKAYFVPTLKSVASASRSYNSAWMQNTSLTEVLHGLTDMEDIRGYEVQEWDVTNAKRRNIDRSGLIVNFDLTKFYFDWTGLTPSATLQYRVVAGGSPLPWSIPVGFDSVTNKSGTGAPNFPFGATGVTATLTDLAISAITHPNATIAGGFVALDNGSEIGTYDGAGLLSTDFGVPLTVNLNTAFGIAAPVASTNYYLYVDLSNLGVPLTQTDTARVVRPVTAADFKGLLTPPSQTSRSRYYPVGFIRSTGTTWPSTGFRSLAGKRHDPGHVSINPVVYSLPKQTVGVVGSVGQVDAGHLLSAKSFPSGMAASKVSYFNFDVDDGATILDDSGNARGLTKEGNPVFTGLGLFGTAGAATLDGTLDNFSSTNAFFNPGNGKPIAMGGWFHKANWQSATTEILVCQFASGADRGFRILYQNGVFHFAGGNTTGSFDQTVTVSTAGLSSGWHHVVWLFDFAAQQLKAYVDGRLVGSGFMTNQRASSSPIFRFGADETSPIDQFTGRIQAGFFVNDHLLTDEDIAKIFAYRIDHNRSLLTQNQEWTANIYGGLGQQDHGSWLVDKSDKDSLFVDFSDQLSTVSVELFLKDIGFSGQALPVLRYDSGYFTAAPASPITHGLPDIPTALTFLYEESAGVWRHVPTENLIDVTATQLILDLSAYTFGASNRGRIIAGMGDQAVMTQAAPSIVTKNTIEAMTVTIPSGQTAFHPQLDIPSGSTYEVQGVLLAPGGISGAGLLTGSGVVADSLTKEALLDQQNNFSQAQLFSQGLMPGPTSDIFNLYRQSGEGEIPSVTWTGTTAPSGTITKRYRWTQVGNRVDIWWRYEASVAGAGLTTFFFALPTDCPTPGNMSGQGNAEWVSPGSGFIAPAPNSLLNTHMSGSGLYKQTSGIYEVYQYHPTSVAASIANGHLTYFV